ncbi:NAD(P)-dependent oxidoreductase [Streptomyces sp. NPDC006207]
MRAGLRGETARLVLLDRVPLVAEAANEEVHTIDLQEADAVRSDLVGVDRVLHLGGIPDEAPLADLLEVNVLGTHHVLEAARRGGIRRVVPTGSNRVTGFHPAGQRTAPDEPVRPDGLYGVSKAAVEALGRLYADKFGLCVICLQHRQLRGGTRRAPPPGDLAQPPRRRRLDPGRAHRAARRALRHGASPPTPAASGNSRPRRCSTAPPSTTPSSTPRASPPRTATPYRTPPCPRAARTPCPRSRSRTFGADPEECCQRPVMGYRGTPQPPSPGRTRPCLSTLR